MFDNLYDATTANLHRAYTASVQRLIQEGKTQAEAAELAKAEVLARHGEAPSLAKVLADQGGPLSGQA